MKKIIISLALLALLAGCAPTGKYAGWEKLYPDRQERKLAIFIDENRTYPLKWKP